MADGANKIVDFGDYIGGEEALAAAARAVRSLKTDINALSKTVGDDSGRIAAGFATIKTGIADIQSKAGKLQLFSGEDKAILAALAQQLGELKTRQEDYKATVAAQKVVQQGLSDVTKQYTSELAKQKDALRAAALAQDVDGQKAAAAAIRQTTLESTQLTKALRGANSEFTAAKGSYDALVLENNKLLASLHGLEGGLNAGSQEAQKLKQQIFDNTETLKLFDTETNRSFRNVGNYAQSFSGLIAELAKARTAQAGLSDGTADYARNQMKVQGFQTAAQKSAAQMGLSYEQAEAKINGVIGAIQPLTTDLLRLEKQQEQVATSAGKESTEYQKLGFQIQSTKKQIDEVATATATAGEKQDALTQQLGFSKEGLKDFALGLAVGAIGLQGIVQGAEAFFQANVQYSRDLAEVRKTTGLTADEADRLGVSLKKLDTPTSLQGLLKIASVGGQLGIAKDDLLGFTQAIDTAVQALGNDFTGGAEEIATTLGKISNVFGKELGSDQAKNILAIGSAVNQLGADGAATAPFLTDVALRVGAVAAQSGLGLKDVLAYASVLQETGFSAETSGTALNRFFSVLSTRTKEAYEIAKNANPALTLKDFTRLVNTDFNGAIQVFLAGLKAGGTTTTALNKELATLKLQSGEAKSAIITLSEQTDLFAERQRAASEQLRDATSLAAEAAINTETLGGSVDKATNSFKNFFTTGAAGGFLKFLVDATRLLYGNTIGAAVQSLGDSIEYLKEKTGLADKPLTDYTASTVANTLAIIKQVGAQEQLLNSYAKLRDNTQRTGAEEVELSNLRAKLVQDYGTAETKAILDSIARNKERVESTKDTLRQEIASFSSGVNEAQHDFAKAQDAISTQLAGKTAEQIAAIRAVAKARAEGEASGVQVDGASLIPQAQIDAATKLNKAEESLKNQQLLRGQAVAALAKLEGSNTAAKLAGADAADVEEKAEAQLDRTAQQRAKNRVDALKDALADNQKRIDALKAYQAQQGKLFADGQLSNAEFAQSVAGSQDLLTQLQRDGTALRIKIAKAETTEQLKEADNSRIQQSKKKNISEEELADIQGQYAEKRIGIFRNEAKAITAANEKLHQDLKEDPLEFKVNGLDAKTLQPVTDGIDKFAENQEKAFQSALNGIQGDTRRQMEAAELARAKGELTESAYQNKLLAIRKDGTSKTLDLLKRFHKSTAEADSAANKEEVDAAKKREEDIKAISEAAGNTLITLDGYYTQFRQNALDTQVQNVQAAYDAELAAAGDNADLKTQIQKKYDKELKYLAYEKAKADRDQAAFTIAIQTAVAVAKSFAESPETFGLPFSAIALANGLLQEALVYSKPLPAYFKGRKNGPAELAEVSERGPELIQRKKTGRFEYIAERAIVPLGQGDAVFTAHETSAMLASVGLTHQQAQQPMQMAAAFGGAAEGVRSSREEREYGNAHELAKGIRSLEDGLRRIKPVVVNVASGSEASVETSNSLTRYYKQRTFGR